MEGACACAAPSLLITIDEACGCHLSCPIACAATAAVPVSEAAAATEETAEAAAAANAAGVSLLFAVAPPFPPSTSSRMEPPRGIYGVIKNN